MTILQPIQNRHGREATPRRLIRHRRKTLPLMLLAVALPWSPIATAAEPAVAKPLLTSSKFTAMLRNPVLAWSWTNQEIGEIVSGIQNSQGLSLLLDRRLNPNQPVTLTLANQPIRSGLQQLAAEGGGHVAIIGSTVFLGPENACRELSLTKEMRAEELRRSESVSSRRKLSLLRRNSIDWDDLSTPREILDQVSRKWNLSIKSLELVPHDMWRGGTLPSMTVVEALSVILVQFNLTFRWSGDGTTVELQAFADLATFPREYRIAPNDRERMLIEWRELLPEADISPTEQGIRLVTDLRGHALISSRQMERASAASTHRNDTTASPKDLSRIEFTLTVADISARDVMARLEQSGIRFEYDSGQLRDAGITFEKNVAIVARKDSADAFFRKLFEPLGLQHTIRGSVVRLRPVQR